MGFKDKINKAFPEAYILAKVKNKKEAHQIIKGYRAIKKQNLFDEDFYVKKYPKTSSMDPLLHYLFFGFKEGKKPNKTFDGAFYVNEYDIDINPLIHYALFGKDKKYSYKVAGNDLSQFKDNTKKSILFILHEKINNVGGTGFTNLDIMKSLDNTYKKFILTSDGEDVELWEYNNKLTKLANWNEQYCNIHSLIDLDKSSKIISKNFEKEFFNPKLASIYEEILSKLDIDFIHINHLINHSFDIFDIADKLEIKYMINIHDFYYCCPSIHLLDKNLNFCNMDCCNNCAINIDDENNLSKILKTWQKQCLNLLKGSYINILPSKSTLDIYKKFYPDLNNLKIIEHGRKLEKLDINPTFANNKIKILFPGFISQHKGSLLIKNIKKLDKADKLEFHFIGTTIPNLKKHGINHGRYNREDFGKIVGKIKPNYIAILSVCPETYSHTLSESISAGIPIITTNLGAQKERVKKDRIGWVVDYKSPENFLNTILNITEEDYNQKLENIKNTKLKDFDEMIEEYKKIYEEI